MNMLLAGREVRIGKNCDRGLEVSIFKPEVTVFLYTDRPQASCRKLAYKWVCLHNFAIELSLRAIYKPFAKNLTSERASKSAAGYYLKKDVLKSRFISSYFMLVHLVPQLKSPKLFSGREISCKVWSCTTETVFVDHCTHSTQLDFSTLNWVADSEEIR